MAAALALPSVGLPTFLMPTVCKNSDAGSSHLLVQPQELAVAHSAVQHPVHVDVVGLQERQQSDPSTCWDPSTQFRGHPREKPLQGPA